MIVTFNLLLLILIAGAIAFYLWCALATAQFFSCAKPGLGSQVEPVSVLIPVCGVDDDSIEKWESLCQQDYENYEVLFGVMHPNDPAVPIIKELVSKYPGRAQLYFCDQVRGLNYQISNLMHLLEVAQHELVVFTDSDVYVSPDYLHTVISGLADPSVGLVTCSYSVRAPQYLMPALVGLGRSIDNIPSVLLARQMNGGSLWFAFGATMATRKSVLASVGGLERVVNHIGTDYLIGNMVSGAGYRVELSHYILETDGERQSFQQLFLRELRWAITIRQTQGILYYGNVFTYGTVYCIPLVLLTGFQSWAVIVSLVTIAMRIVQALIAIYCTGCSKLLPWLWVLPVRDLLSFVLFVGGTFGSHVYWRGRQLSIGKGGILKDLTQLG